MKNKKLFLGMVMTVIATLGYAKTPKTEFQVEVLGSKTFSVIINETAEDLDIYFLNNMDSILYKNDVIAGESFGEQFDMDNLPEGKYQLKVVDAFSIQVLNVEFLSGNVSLDLNASRYYDIPEVTRLSEVSIVRMNSISMDPMKMVIDNKTGRVQYSGRAEGKKYDFNLSLMDDSPKIVVNSEGHITMKSVALSGI